MTDHDPHRFDPHPPLPPCRHCGTGELLDDNGHCHDCSDTTAAFRFWGGDERFDDLCGRRAGVVVVRDDLGGRLSEYRGLRRVKGEPQTLEEWDAAHDVRTPDPDDHSDEAWELRRVAARTHLRHVIALDHRLPADVASCRLWHEAVHAAHREVDPLHPVPCREYELDALIERCTRRDWPGPQPFHDLHVEVVARQAEGLTWEYGHAVRANLRVTLPPADVAAPRIVRADAGEIVLHPGHDAYMAARRRTISYAWELAGEMPFGGWAPTAKTFAEHEESIEQARLLREFAIELGVDPDAALSDPGPAPEPPSPRFASWPRWAPRTRRPGASIVVLRFPSLPEAMNEERPSMRELFAIVAAEGLPPIAVERPR